MATSRTKLIGKLSKGYRQRVGLAQAIIHNPDVLILDEPTSGLDPQQIIEIRHLLKSLAGEHTIILSTHILPEVEQSCERVIIISRGRVVAMDTVANLTNRMRGSEAIAVEIEAAADHPTVSEAQQRLEQVSGVSRVVAKEPKDGRLRYEVESLQGRQIRADLARTVVNAGWNLNELAGIGSSLEDIFLQLTGVRSENRGAGAAPPAEPETASRGPAMKNIILIASKELKSYFASPIAYLLMAAFALIFGFTFYVATRDMIKMSLQAQMMGQQQPMNVNDQIIRPLLGFAGTITLFLVPMITMRLIAEEKRTGTIELLLTSPIKDNEIIIGKWLGAMLLFLCILAMSMINIAMLFIWGKPDLQPVLVAYLGLILQGGYPACHRRVHLHHDQEPDHRRRRHFLCLPVPLSLELVHGVR